MEAATIPTHMAVSVRVHGTPTEIWDTLARVFEVSMGEHCQWVTLHGEGGTEVTFFGPQLNASA